MAVTRVRGVRIGEPLWGDAQAIANDNGETVTAAIHRCLEEYVGRGGGGLRAAAEQVVASRHNLAKLNDAIAQLAKALREDA